MADTVPRQMTIDIFSDVMCPWCIIGYSQLQKSLAELKGEIEAEIRWRPFELNPDMPADGEDQAAHLARKYSRTAEQSQQMRGQMRSVAEDAGVSLEYQGEGDAPAAMMWNTFDTHKVLAWALDTAGPQVQNALKLALFKAHFNERRKIGERSILLDIAEEAGLDRAGAQSALDDADLAKRVRAEQAQAFDMNITGVPAMIVDGKMLIPGAQAPEAYTNAIRRVAAKFPA